MCEALLTHPSTCMCVTDGFSEEPKRGEKGKGKQVQIKSKLERETKTFSVIKKNPLKMLQKLMIKKKHYSLSLITCRLIST